MAKLYDVFNTNHKGIIVPLWLWNIIWIGDLITTRNIWGVLVPLGSLWMGWMVWKDKWKSYTCN